VLNAACRRQSHSNTFLNEGSVTISEFGDSRRFLRSLTFLRQCGQRFSTAILTECVTVRR